MLLTIKAPFQTMISIKTNSDQLAFSLRLKYGAFLSQAKKQCGLMITATDENHSFTISFDGKTYKTKNALQDIDCIIFENIRYDDSIFALHGAAVEYDGRAYLFLASTTSGKTTLASYLSAMGFGYITDDCILLDRKNFEIYPYNTPIHLREGGLEVLKKYNAAPKDIALLDDPKMKRYIYTPEKCVTEKLPLSKIFFIKRTENENRIAEMTATERMTELMKAPITYYPLTGEYIKFISALSKAVCCRLLYSDMDYVAKVIQNG